MPRVKDVVAHFLADGSCYLGVPMSLIIYPYRRSSPDAGPEFLPLTPTYNECFGSEGSRRSVWGHDAVVRRGLKVLPEPDWICWNRTWP